MNLFKKYSIKLDYMDATDILYIPNDERVNRIIINMSYSEKIYTLESLLKNFKSTYKNGTTYFTLLSVSFMISILSDIVNKCYQNEDTSAYFASMNSILLDYISFAEKENICPRKSFDEQSNLRKLLPHGDILPMALEYGYTNLIENIIYPADYEIAQRIMDTLNKINGKYFNYGSTIVA